jgi:hypothetical protein
MPEKPKPEPTITSRPYHPKACCEKCVFGSGRHSRVCDKFEIDDEIAGVDLMINDAAYMGRMQVAMDQCDGESFGATWLQPKEEF